MELFAQVTRDGNVSTVRVFRQEGDTTPLPLSAFSEESVTRALETLAHVGCSATAGEDGASIVLTYEHEQNAAADVAAVEGITADRLALKG